MTTAAAPRATGKLAPTKWRPMPKLRDNRALVTLLGDVCAFDPDHDGEEWRTAFVLSLRDAAYAAVWIWARELAWALDGAVPAGVTRVVRASRLVLPPIMTHLADPEVASIEAMLASKTLTATQLRGDERP